MPTSVFISYSYSSNDHESWVRSLANDLEVDRDIHVVFDKYDIDCSDDKNLYMEKSINEADKVILICDTHYKLKADERKAGVGIEASQMIPIYHKDIGENGKSKFIAILREKNSIPRFLKNNFYIDFTNENKYSENLTELKREIKGQRKITRPPKEDNSWESRLELKNIENIIAECAKNREKIYEENDAKRKVKYEIWETKSPNSSFFLALNHNINISQTFASANEYFKANPIIRSVTVLRTRPAKEGFTGKELLSNIRGEINDYTYDNFLWTYGIDSSLKIMPPADKIKYYTSQDIEVIGGEKEQDASRYLANQLKEHSKYTAHLVLADGGMGKTSLCQAVANELNRTNSNNCIVVIISADAVRKYLDNIGKDKISISSIYDIYWAQSSHYQEKAFFTRSTFELAAITGNIIIIIDGLDEIERLLAIPTVDFLKSISEMHHELGSSQILITSRNSEIISDEEANQLDIKKYKLLGFTVKNCEKYLESRFKEHPKQERIKTKIIEQITNTTLIEGENRIVPFFVDILASEYEKNDEDKESGFSIGGQDIPYPNQGKVVDHLIFSVFKREKKRQGIDEIGLSDIVEIFTESCATMGSKWNSNKVFENIKILFDDKSTEIFRSLCINPLLINNENDGILELKYEFLLDYFKFVYIIQKLKQCSLEKDFINTMALLPEDSTVMKEVTKYHLNQKNEFIKNSKTLLAMLKNEKHGEKITEKTLNDFTSSIICILGTLKSSTNEFTSSLMELIGTEENGERITASGIHIKGDVPPIDFSGKIILNSTFNGYTRFLKSKFDDSYFAYCKFRDCASNDYKGTNLSRNNIELKNCTLGDLKNVLDLIDESVVSNRELIEREAAAFLESFRRGLAFRDNNKTHIRFSSKIKGLHKDNFHKIVQNNFIKIATQKEVDTFYEIPDHFKESVRKFLNDSSCDAKIDNFISFISNQ